MVSTDSCLAESMNEQVFTTTMSASSARVVISAPAWFRSPIMTSLSTRFLGQPRLTNPIFFFMELDKWELWRLETEEEISEKPSTRMQSLNFIIWRLQVGLQHTCRIHLFFETASISL